MTFEANEKVLGLSISGGPGVQGFLRVSLVTGQGEKTVMKIPFVLAPCLWGFRLERLANEVC